jgi:hypothetical protein
MTVRARQPLVAALLALGALAGPPAVAQAHTAQTQAPSPITSTAAVFHGLVNPQGHKTTYWFEFGTTTAYGTATHPASAGKGTSAVAVTVGSGALQPATAYHVRLVASDDEGFEYGGDVTFVTAAAPPAAPQTPVTPVPTPVPPAPLPGTQDDPAPAPAPQLAISVGLAPQQGSVFVRVPGASRPVVLGQGSTVPVGSIVDTRGGTVTLRTALPGGATQTGSFHGGVFQIRQPARGQGLTELVLRGPLPSCPTGSMQAATATRRRPPRALWGRDDHGKFQTRGSNAVATVRGTVWYVADRCDGTLTRVRKGSVAVRDLHTGRTVIVHAGHSYLARRA